MATVQGALICAAFATAFWGLVGLPIALRIFPRSLAVALAPSLGWALHSVVALPLFYVIGMTKAAVAVTVGFSAVGALLFLLAYPRAIPSDDPPFYVPPWAVVGAALLAFAIMRSVLPQHSVDGVAFAGPIFDHAKVAIIDDIVRLGVPAGNPFFGEVGSSDKLAYYYLWHFSAAELSIVTGQGGWNADAGMTFFTAFSSIFLMMGFALWLSRRSSSTAWVLAIAASASIRYVFIWMFGFPATAAITGYTTGFGAWLFQTMWAPQHVASANCAVIAIVLLVKLAEQPALLTSVTMALAAAASFQSSTWVGGITFPLAALAIGLSMMVKIDGFRRWKVLAYVAGAAALSVALDLPFIIEQIRSSIVRADSFPIGIEPYSIVDDGLPARGLLNVIAYWTTFLGTEFAAFYPVGIFMMMKLVRDASLTNDRRLVARMFGWLALISLGVGCLLISRVAINNDLAWRGVLPAIFVLIVAASAGLPRYLQSIGRVYAVLFVGLVVLSALEGGKLIFKNQYVSQTARSTLFSKSEQMWSAVRKHAGSSERIANNPLFLAEMTPWPVNISWALLANRRSCYAAEDLALPFARTAFAKRQEIDALFTRVFAGKSNAKDIVMMANAYGCKVIVVTAQDGAWSNDPFAASAIYRLVEAKPDEWRVYKQTER